jgi:hypothetical protein
MAALAAAATLAAPGVHSAAAAATYPFAGLAGAALTADRPSSTTPLRFQPRRVTAHYATFAVSAPAGRDVVSARLTAAGGRVRPVAVAAVRRAAAAAHGAGGLLKVSLPRSWWTVRPAARLGMRLVVDVRADAFVALAAQAPAGAVLWKADAEAPIAAEWASSSSMPAAASPPAADPTRIAQNAFRVQGKRSYRFEIRDGDDAYGERAELGQALPTSPGYENRIFYPGQERWISMQYYLPSDWLPTDTWQTIFQIKPVSPGGGGPSIGLGAGSNRLMVYGNTNEWGSTAGNIFDGAGTLPGASYPLTRGRWIRLTWHVVFSADPAVGSLEMFGNLADGKGMRTLVPLRRRATMKYLDGVMDPAQLRVGIYRDPDLTQTESLFVDGITVASSRAVDEANAFGA